MRPAEGRTPSSQEQPGPSYRPSKSICFRDADEPDDGKIAAALGFRAPLFQSRGVPSRALGLGFKVQGLGFRV